MLDLKRYRWEGGVGARDWLGSALKPGKHTIVFDFKYDGPGPENPHPAPGHHHACKRGSMAQKARAGIGQGRFVMSDALLIKLNQAVKAANEAEASVTTAQTELVSRSKAVGLLLLEAKQLHPLVIDFEAYLKRVDGLADKLAKRYRKLVEA